MLRSTDGAVVSSSIGRMVRSWVALGYQGLFGARSPPPVCHTPRVVLRRSERVAAQVATPSGRSRSVRWR
jgi:hypothetical protein